MPLDIVHSVCPHDCPSTCALEVEVLDARTIGRVRGAADNSYTAGVVCAKTARYAERVHHPERLSRPLQRTGAKGEGDWREISWDAALDSIADAFVKSAQKHGSESVWPYYYAGTMGLVQRDGINRLRHVMGYSEQYSTFCVTLSDAGWLAGTGAKMGSDAREMAESDLIVVWGGNPVHTQVNVMTHVSRARKERGAKLAVIDTYRTSTAEQADIFLCVNPGTDGALACAVMHVLFKEGFADREYLAKYTDAPAELEAHLATRTPEWASAICGVPVAEILAFARLYGATQRSYIRAGYGFSRSRNGAAQMHAVTCLPAITGAWKHRGGGALYGQGKIYHWNKTLIEGLDRIDPAIRSLDQSQIGRILTGDAAALRNGPPVTAMLIQSTNPATVAPESLLVNKGFRRDDLFVAVHEQFLTDTAKLADIVLPATTFLEHDDIYQASGHSFIQIGRKVIEPLGEAKENHWVVCELAKRLGAEHPGFGLSAWDMVDETLKASGWPDAQTIWAGRWHDAIPDFDSAHFVNGFGHPDGKFRFKPDWHQAGVDPSIMPVLPDHADIIDKPDAARPFRLVAAPSRSFLNTSFSETPGSKKREGRPTLRVHPEDLARLGLEDGQRVRLGNDRGSVVLHARSFPGLNAGTVICEGIWPNDAFEEGIGINALTSADPGYPKGGAVFHDTAVWLREA
ncbi:MAG: molybdopterin oxidoreductase family protein [Alphaproteobacteria bacterium]|nr:molybdopterin oxidoreductase family protein [Alphaproteobacteria bacterium]MBU0798546.1 molybdopterin oxidoreductase family protein [Alphaproteobacteria bacterium]MBU0885699.1 molybdopterin oxidoreductase family protein [Alphaproteobacteria bacterium]MBU1813782.1 molybdopterin oxidoreductase family protein [Alphaproteobacteria bacterium]